MIMNEFIELTEAKNGNKMMVKISDIVAIFQDGDYSNVKTNAFGCVTVKETYDTIRKMITG